tara:strand:- start:106 stop:912 length:807 start_codon:yes stop_codon:yes gene_type:complete
MSDDLSAAVAAAADAVDIPGPAPEPEALDTELDEGVDTFDRPYVEKLRSEAASKRTELRGYKDAFTGFTPEETTRFLELAADLNANPEKALEGFQGVTDRLAAQLGKAKPPMPEEIVPVAVEAAAVEVAAAVPGLTSDDVTRMVNERMDAERATADAAAATRNVFAEAAQLSEAYVEGSPALVQLLAVAQNDPAANGNLVDAHGILMNQIAEIENAAVEAYRNGIRSGAKHPPVVAGQAATALESEPPKTIEEASRRARERLNATYDG